MKKLVALGLFIGSLMSVFVGANPMMASQEISEQEMQEIEALRKDIRQQVVAQAKQVGQELSEQELDQIVDMEILRIAIRQQVALQAKEEGKELTEEELDQKTEEEMQKLFKMAMKAFNAVAEKQQA